MAVNPMMSNAQQGMSLSLQKLEDSAARIASGAVSKDSDGNAAVAPAGLSGVPARASDEVDQAEALVSMKLYAREVQAAAKVVETADATVGFLLDTQA